MFQSFIVHLLMANTEIIFNLISKKHQSVKYEVLYERKHLTKPVKTQLGGFYKTLSVCKLKSSVKHVSNLETVKFQLLDLQEGG
jgi:hypothetical protein